MDQIPGRTQICKSCQIARNLDNDFRNRIKNGVVCVERVCKQCQYQRASKRRSTEEFRQIQRQKYAENKDAINDLRRSKYIKRERKPKEKVSKEHKLQKIKEWQKTNPDKRKATVNKYHRIHVDQEKQYYQENKEKIKTRIANYKKQNKDSINFKLNEKRKNPIVRLRHNISCLIRCNIKNKKYESCMKYLPYTIQELKQHLENKFEPWMNWSNWGGYDSKTWNDQDSTTWTWQIDHIIPQSVLTYSSMEEENFKKCWALNNLRPLSAKQNCLDGARLERK